MPKDTLKIINIYSKNKITITELIQEWINENYFLLNLNNDIT